MSVFDFQTIRQLIGSSHYYQVLTIFPKNRRNELMDRRGTDHKPSSVQMGCRPNGPTEYAKCGKAERRKWPYYQIFAFYKEVAVLHRFGFPPASPLPLRLPGAGSADGGGRRQHCGAKCDGVLCDDGRRRVGVLRAPRMQRAVSDVPGPGDGGRDDGDVAEFLQRGDVRGIHRQIREE